MSHYITVIVVKDGRGQAGCRVKAYGGQEQRTDSSGKATIEAAGSNVTIYVDGSQKYDGSASRCPNPLTIHK